MVPGHTHEQVAHSVRAETRHSRITELQFERVPEELSYWPVWLEDVEQSMFRRGTF